MNVTQIALEKKRITFVTLAIIFVIGILTYNNMPRAEDPGFIIRTALVQTIFPGASPDRIEQLITDKLEEAIQEMPEIDFIASRSKPGISIIFVNIKESYSAMRPIWDSLRRKVDRASSQLPSGIIGPIINDEFGDVFGSMITITGEGYSPAELKEIADDTRNELLLIEEVAKVEIYGAQEERVFVEFNNARLAELGISPGQLQSILESRNIIFPGGEIFTKDEQIVLEPSGNFESVDELKRAVINLPGKSDLVFLGDVANIYRGYIDPAKMKVTYNGNPALILALSLREGGNIIALGEAVTEKINRFKSVYPIGLDFEIFHFQPDFVKKKIDGFVKNLLQAIGIVVVVMLIFLGLRTGLVIVSLIPMAIVMALMIMGFLDIGLDQMSLSALIISLGLVVDNAIVMSESIMVQMQQGKKPVQAALESASELRVPLLISSLTTSAAFLPIYLAESTVGEYTAPIFEVVTITLICSWILALTMTPLFCVIFFKVKNRESKVTYESKFYRSYRRFLLLILRHRMLSIIAILVIFFATMQLTPYIPAIFFPANDKPVMYAELKLPVGTPLKKTEKMVYKIESFIQREMMAEFSEDNKIIQDGVTDWASFIGGGAPRFYLSLNVEPQSPEYAYILVNVTKRWMMETDFIPKLEITAWRTSPIFLTQLRPLAWDRLLLHPYKFGFPAQKPTRSLILQSKLKVNSPQLPVRKTFMMTGVKEPRNCLSRSTSQGRSVRD